MTPLLTQVIVGQSSLDAPLDVPIASSNSRPKFGDVNLDTDGFLKVRTAMLASSDSDDTPQGAPARASSKNKSAMIFAQHHNCIDNLPSYPVFMDGVTNLYCLCSAGLKPWCKSINCDMEPITQCTGSFANTANLRAHCKDLGGV